MEIEKYSPKWLLEKINNSKNDAHKLMHIIEYSKEIIKSTDQQLILSGVSKSLIMNRRQIEKANQETKKMLGLILKINGTAIVVILTTYTVLNILGLW